jgi:hypothetical protein
MALLSPLRSDRFRLLGFPSPGNGFSCRSEHDLKGAAWPALLMFRLAPWRVFGDARMVLFAVLIEMISEPSHGVYLSYQPLITVVENGRLDRRRITIHCRERKHHRSRSRLGNAGTGKTKPLWVYRTLAASPFPESAPILIRCRFKIKSAIHFPLNA